LANFTNLKDLEAYLQRNMHQVLRDSMELERELATIMSQTIIEKVYEAYIPETQQALDMRRGENNLGLADPRNMIISNILFEKRQLRILFENIAEGRDTMQDDMLVDAFENPTKEGYWSSQGKWSSRSFINETAERIRQNPHGVINAIKQNLKEAGFVVKG
jgi:hypothetical protein